MTSIVVQFAGSVALLIWAVAMLRGTLIGHVTNKVPRVLAAIGRNRLGTAAAGLLTALAIQSSSATIVLITGMAERGVLSLSAAIAGAAGADAGSALAVLILAHHPPALWPALLLLGVILAGRHGTVSVFGRALVALALVILALSLIVAATAPVRDSPLFRLILARTATDPMMPLVIGAALCWAGHSSVAAILLTATFTGAGVLAPHAALYMALGINLGAALIPLGAVRSRSGAARTVMIANLMLRGGAALLATAVLVGLDPPLGGLGEGALAPVHLHLLFNLTLVLVAIPLAGPLARVPIARNDASADTPDSHLSDALLGSPGPALAAATREVLILADRVEELFDRSVALFNRDDATADDVSALDDTIDAIEGRVRAFLIALSREALPREQADRAHALLRFAADLEHVGDVIDASLVKLAHKRDRLGLRMPAEDRAEIAAQAELVRQQIRLAVTVLLTGDRGSARELVVRKEAIRERERAAADRGLERARRDPQADPAADVVFRDVLRDLKRIAAHLTSVAHPVLEADGALRTSRLRRSDRPVAAT